MDCKKHTKPVPMFQCKIENIPVGHICILCYSFIPDIDNVHLDLLKYMIKSRKT